MRVRILEWFGGRFGLAFGSLLGSFWSTLAPLWGPFGLPLGPLGACWVSFLSLFTTFRLGASGHSGVPLCAFVSP